MTPVSIREDKLLWKVAGALPVIGTYISSELIKKLDAETQHQINPTRHLELRNLYTITYLVSAASTLILTITGVALGILAPTLTLLVIGTCYAIMLGCMAFVAPGDIAENNRIIELHKQHG